MIEVSFTCIKVLVRERPAIIISTGGGATIPLSYLGKLMGKHIIFIESLTRVNALSGTGKFLYPIADLFLVQWETLQRNYPKSKYWGRVI